MDIKDIKVYKKQLETDITNHISALVDTFIKDTGLMPRSIDICLFPVITVGKNTDSACINTHVTLVI